MRQVRSDRRLLFRSLVLAVTTVQRGMARLNLSTCMPRKKLSSPHWHGSHHSFTVCKNAAAATSNTVKCKLRFSLNTGTLYFPANFTKLAMCCLRFNRAFLLPSGLVNSRYDDIFFSFLSSLSVCLFFQWATDLLLHTKAAGALCRRDDDAFSSYADDRTVCSMLLGGVKIEEELFRATTTKLWELEEAENIIQWLKILFLLLLLLLLQLPKRGERSQRTTTL